MTANHVVERGAADGGQSDEDLVQRVDGRVDARLAVVLIAVESAGQPA